MQREFWQTGWDQGRTGFHRNNVNPYLQRYWSALGAAPGSRVFVPLCGKSLDLLWLRDRGHRVVGVEVVHRAVEAFFAENGLAAATAAKGPFVAWTADGIEILEGDFFDLTAEETGDVAAVYDRASLIALPPAMRQRYAAQLRAILPAAAKVLLITLEYPQADMDGPPFSVTEGEVAALYQESFEIERLCTEDGLAANAQLRERGLSRLTENVYALRPR